MKTTNLYMSNNYYNSKNLFNTNFQSSIPTQLNTQENKKMSACVKYAIGLGLTTLAAGGIYLLTKGKKGIKNLENQNQKIKDYTMQTFKDAGNNIEKGRAKLANGEFYTGTISQETKDGKNILREYKNGLIQKRTNGKGENILYKYDDNENLLEITQNNNIIYQIQNTDKTKLIITPKSKVQYNIDTGNVLFKQDKNGQKLYTYTEENKLYSIKHNNGDINDLYIYNKDGKTCRVKISNNGINGVTIYDDTGKINDTIPYIDLNRGGDSYTYKNFSCHTSHQPGYTTTNYMDNVTSETLNKRTNTDGIKLTYSTEINDKDQFVTWFENSNQYKVQYNGKIIEREENPEIFDRLVSNAQKYYSDTKTKETELLKIKDEINTLEHKNLSLNLI